jgi:hypothetical protein
MKARKSLLSATVVTGALVALAGLPAGTALAGTGGTSGKVPCSGKGGGAAGLVAAITTANAAGGGAIRLAPGCTYKLSAADNSGPLGDNGLPVVTTPITITGAHSTIARSGAQPFRIAEVDGPGGSLTLTGLTLTGGDDVGPGGAVFNNAGTLTLNFSAVTGNASEGGMMSAGGGIASGTVGNGPVGTLVLNASVVSGNTTTGGGGGILNHAGTATLNASRVSGNAAANGGGIASGPGNGGAPGSGSSLTLNGSSVDHNTTTAGGGAPAGGGIANGDIAVIRGSVVAGNTAPGGLGAGILNHGTMTISGSLVKGNSAQADSSGNPGVGGGIANLNAGVPGSGVLTIKGGAVIGNSASGSAGGIANQGGTVTLKGTLVARNVPDNCEPPGTIAGCVG